MTTTGRKTVCITVFMLIAGCAIASATRFTASATAAPSSEGAAAEVAPPNPQEAGSPPPDKVADPDDPKLAGHFSGRVTGSDGKPVSRARVFIWPLSDGLDGELTARAKTDALTIRAETDGDGRFEFEAPDTILTDLDGLPTRRRCFVIATADGYGPDWREIRGRTRSSRIRKLVNGTDLALQLATDDVPIHGQFFDPDGRPLAGARVQVTRLMIPKLRDLNTYIDYVTRDNSAIMNGPDYERSLPRPIRLPALTTEARTDADGRFTLSGLGRDRLAELKVSAPSVVDTTVTVMTRDAPDVGTHRLNGEPREVTYGARFTLQLKRGLTITGLVREHDSHKPIPGMWVGWRGDPLNGLSSGEYSRTTDANGRFTITGLDPRLLEWDKPLREIMAVSAPGLPYQTAIAEVNRDSEVLIECPRGIPFRLRLLDEQGRPVAAEVTYREVQPNPHLPRMPYVYDGRWPIGRTDHRGGGIYEGFVLPGPGAVLVKTLGRSAYRPAHVDPKAFFAPGRTNWTAQERITAYGTQDTLSTSQVWINQHDYSAIVLINPAPDSGPLELSATVVKDRPRHVSLVDANSKPVFGVQTTGMTFHPWGYEPPLRAASFPLTGLHPDRVRRITFIEEDRQLIGVLLARGDGDTPYTVLMQPWGAVTGQLLDENGKPVEASFSLGRNPLETNADPDVGEHADIAIDTEGRFRIDRLVPGLRYTARIYRSFQFSGMAFENLVVRPGEVRDLGDIRTKSPDDEESGIKPRN